MERPMLPNSAVAVSCGESAFSCDLRIYPRFYDGPSVRKYVIPIKWAFHVVLFPEVAEARDLPLFPEQVFFVTASRGAERTPGNTIRKVYICRSATRTLDAGDVVLFYLSKCADLKRSQSVTTIGIVEQAQLATTATDLIRKVGRRSVYSRETLEAMNPTAQSPVLVIDFLLNGHLEPHVSVEKLLQIGAFVGKPPQSVKCISHEVYEAVTSSTCLSFE